MKKTTYPIPTITSGAVAGKPPIRSRTSAKRIEYDDILTLASRSSPSQDATLLIDARPVSSYESGHIPSSLSFDFPTSLQTDSEGHTSIREPEELKQQLEEKYGKDVVADILSGKTSVVNSESRYPLSTSAQLMAQPAAVDFRPLSTGLNFSLSMSTASYTTR